MAERTEGEQAPLGEVPQSKPGLGSIPNNTVKETSRARDVDQQRKALAVKADHRNHMMERDLT